MRIAVTQCGYALEYASDELRANKEIVKIALGKPQDEEEDPPALDYASEDLRNDEEVAQLAVSYDEWSLGPLSEALRKNRAIIGRTAVLQDGRVLEFAAADLRRDDDFVKARVAESPLALPDASQILRGNARS